MHFSYIVASTTDGLNGEFLQCHITSDNLFHGFDGCINRTVSTGSCLEFFACNQKSNACHRFHSNSGSNLQIINFYALIFHTFHSGQHHYIVVVDVFFLIGKFQEFFVDFIQFSIVHFNAKHAQTMFQRCTAASGSQKNRIFVNSNIGRIHDFVAFAVFQHTILVNSR